MRYIFVGKVVNTHGIKGEIRLLSKFEFKEKAFAPGMKLYIGRDKVCEVIRSYRRHKSFEMLTLEGYDNINQVLKYKGDYCFIDADDLILANDEYLDSDLIHVMCYVGAKEIGKVKRIEEIAANRKLLIVDVSGQEVMVPYVKEFVHYDKKKKVIQLTVPEGLLP